MNAKAKAVKVLGSMPLLLSGLGVTFLLCTPQIHATPASPADSGNLLAPTTPRDFFNAGTKQLREKKFREAEAFFESTLASQNSALQPLALYNLGHVR